MIWYQITVVNMLIENDPPLTVPTCSYLYSKAWSLGGQTFGIHQARLYFLFPQMPAMKLLTPPTLLSRFLRTKLTLDKSLLCSSHSSSSLEANVAPALVDGL
jgi:hypothetical protein